MVVNLVRGAHSTSAMAAPGSIPMSNFSFQVEPTSVDARGACKAMAAASGHRVNCVKRLNRWSILLASMLVPAASARGH